MEKKTIGIHKSDIFPYSMGHLFVTKKDRQALKELLTNWSVKPAGTLGWKKAEVMLGGVDTKDLDGQTMMARKHLGLFFIGECVDVTGHLGGHNFQWAWASAFACAHAL